MMQMIKMNQILHGSDLYRLSEALGPQKAVLHAAEGVVDEVEGGTGGGASDQPQLGQGAFAKTQQLLDELMTFIA